MADAKLDFIDGFYSQENHINWHRYTKGGWEAYFEHSFKCSAVLREVFCGEEDEYGHKLQDFVAKKFPSGMCTDKKAKPFTPPNNYCE